MMSNNSPTTISFEVTLIAPDDYPISAVIIIPFEVKEIFGTKSRVPVKITVDGHTFRSSLAPMGGCHMMVFNREMREKTGYKAGDTIRVVMEKDDEPRIVKIPEDVLAALQTNQQAYDKFMKYSYSHKKEVMDWINEAKKTETRNKRIQKLLFILSGV